jgi:hypothetical protein
MMSRPPTRFAPVIAISASGMTERQADGCGRFGFTAMMRPFGAPFVVWK